MISIKNKKFIKITKSDQEYFGGNQSWWKDEDTIMKERGCGVIAMCNLELYLNGTSNKGITYQEYKNYVNERRQKCYYISNNRQISRLGLMPVTMEGGLEKYFDNRNMSPISWAPTLKKKRIRKLIEKMLNNNIPIVASYYVFNKKNKLDLYSYNEVDESFTKVADMKRHYFNIVGITSRDSQELLVISTWGKKYYVIYKEWLKKMSIFSNILYIE